ncbi:MAG TPA: DUF1839 family protein [Burkholderiaceae bacterium]|nr:DUF1839 family protein [Burkholderiaceae bacterium]
MTVPGGLADAGRARHALHGEGSIWVEKNCYVDVWIELLHALRLEPHACLPFVFAIDFEGDQWTFFKPPLAELRTLYGIDVQELTVWRPLADHAAEHLTAGRLLAVEVDAHWLPDTAGTDYRQAHAKTTIVLNEFDRAARRLGYFHNAGYFTLDGDDFDALFDNAPPLPPYAELIRIDRAHARPDAELRALSARLLAQHLAFGPRDNPLRRFQARFDADQPGLREHGLAHYHRYAFAGIRQFGAAYELGAQYLRWSGAEPGGTAAAAFERIAQHAKTLILKAARSVNSGRPLDAAALFDEMAAAWDAGMAALAVR